MMNAIQITASRDKPGPSACQLLLHTAGVTLGSATFVRSLAG